MTAETVRIRSRRATDVPACADLMLRTHRADGYPRYWPHHPRRFLAARQEIGGWVAERGKTLLGHVALHDAVGDPALPAAQRATNLPPSRLAVIARLLVAPEVRGCGLGRRLLAVVLDAADARNRRCVLDVTRDNAPANNLYASAGWTRLERLDLPVRGGPVLDLWVYLGPPPAQPPPS